MPKGDKPRLNSIVKVDDPPKSVLAAKRETGRTFAQMLADGGELPHEVLLNRMRDPECPPNEKVLIADRLMPYTVPRLAPVEAQPQVSELSHEEWLQEMETEEHEA